MAEHQCSNELSPALEAVLGSLNVNLEAELNRYRRTRHVHSAVEEDIFADLDAVIEISPDISADFSVAQSSSVIPPLAPTASSAPPPLPPNKKLSKQLPTAESNIEGDINSEISLQTVTQSGALVARLRADSLAASALKENSPKEEKSGLDRDAAIIQAPRSNGYLASSEQLLESFNEITDLPDPVSLKPEPKRKTISLMAGAALGLLALIAGLGASYVMSTPEMAQTLAGGFKRKSATINPLPQRTFDPPGPDLSAQEFVNLKLDNLSSLNMRPSLDPLATSAAPVSPALPPIGSPPKGTAEGGAAEGADLTAQPGLPSPSATQALSIPAGTNYYVTVPFSTEQGLIEIRKAIEEAFVRQFSDGNRIQLAVFDNPETAQSFIAKLQTQGIQAQIYGPTVE